MRARPQRRSEVAAEVTRLSVPENSKTIREPPYVGCHFFGRLLAIRGVFEALFLDFRAILPDDGAGARVDELKRVEDVITRAF